MFDTNCVALLFLREAYYLFDFVTQNSGSGCLGDDIIIIFLDWIFMPLVALSMFPLWRALRGSGGFREN